MTAAARIPGVVDRPRLHRLLDAPDPQICVLLGPSGIGKTTLLRSWALQRESDEPLIWISLESGIASRSAFWQQVVSSARRLADLSADEASRLGTAPDPAAVAVRILAAAGPVTVVLDAYEHLGDIAAEVDADVLRVVSQAPRLRVLVATRGNTTLAADAHQLRGLAHVVDSRALALTTDEIAELVVTHLGREDRGLAASIGRGTRGYALAVRAAVLALARLGEAPRIGSVEWETAVASDLASLLPDEAAAEFLVATSVAPYFDAPLAERLTRHPDVPGLLSFLERNGFGRWVPYARGRSVFQYVESIRDSFRARAAADGSALRAASATVAAWLFDNEDYDHSLRYAIDAEDYAFAERVFLHLLVTDPSSYISDRFLGSLHGLSAATQEEHPLLAFALGLALACSPVLRSDAVGPFRRVLDSPVQPSYFEPAFDRFADESLRAVAWRLVFRFRESAEASAKAVQLAEELDPDLRTQLGDFVATILRQLSYSLLQGGRYDEALSTMTRSASLCTSQTSRNYSVAYAAGTFAFLGDVAKARATQVTIDYGVWPDVFRQSYMNAFGLLAEGYALLDDLDFAGAVGLFGETASYTQTAEFWPFLTAIPMAARLGLGQARAEAERIARELAAPFPPPGFGDNVASEHLCGVLALLWLAAGDLAAARAVIESQPADSPHLSPARLAALLHAGHYREALRCAATELALPGHTVRTRAATQTLAAAAALRQGDEAEALVLLQGAAIAYETYGVRSHLTYLSDHDHQALVRFAGRVGPAGLAAYVDVGLPRTAATTTRTPTLTSRERAVLQALAVHGSTRAAAEVLYVSPNTVKTQLRSVYRKLGVSSREAALSIAGQMGLLDPSGSGPGPGTGPGAGPGAGPGTGPGSGPGTGSGQ
ncbi:hypothetical protein GCM10009788_14980 [Nocardioides humi]|uniref:HTH luxR-type domain-containing protein n=1 Tax=Nocardioides humi TaxID=449461 RepID=A0ABN2A5M9_9ACTN